MFEKNYSIKMEKIYERSRRNLTKLLEKLEKNKRAEIRIHLDTKFCNFLRKVGYSPERIVNVLVGPKLIEKGYLTVEIPDEKNMVLRPKRGYNSILKMAKGIEKTNSYIV